MPTKAQKSKVKKVMGEFKKGSLRSGSKTGPKVKDRKQAVAIALSESGQSAKRSSATNNSDAAKRKKRLDGVSF